MARKRQPEFYTQVWEHPKFVNAKPLLERHGLVDVMDMAQALEDMLSGTIREVEDHGDTAMAGWLKREWMGWQATVGISQMHPLPPSAADALREVYRRTWRRLLPDKLWTVPLDRIRPGHLLGYLYHLHVQKGVSPFLWASRDQVTMDKAMVSGCLDLSWVTVIRTAPLSAGRAKLPSWGMVENMSLDNNDWWETECWLMAKDLAQLTPRQLTRALNTEDWLRRGADKELDGWELVWRPRETQVLLVRYPLPVSQRPRIRLAAVPFPELRYVPFYRADQLPVLYEGLVMCRFSLPLLGRLCDTDFKRLNLVKFMRDMHGYPPLKKAGRPRRDPARVEEMRRIFEEVGTVYGGAKKAGMPVSTYRGYLPDPSKRRRDRRRLANT
jgi:hypothetical protein